VTVTGEERCAICGNPPREGEPWVFIPWDGETTRPAHGSCADERGVEPVGSDETGPVGG
jgi:hypothetical protein